MAYEKQTWKTGDVITAEKLNHVEDGIINSVKPTKGFINNNMDTIVPITAIDRLSLVGEMLKLTGKTFNVVAADTTEGDFTLVADTSGATTGTPALLNQPARSITLSEDGYGECYFIPSYVFEGFRTYANRDFGPAKDENAQPVEIIADGVTLYHATHKPGAWFTVERITPAAPSPVAN